jgi:LuxR family transcriptional regulator, quorum-sensing system regulator BjaR1
MSISELVVVKNVFNLKYMSMLKKGLIRGSRARNMNEALILTFETDVWSSGAATDHQGFFQDELRHTGFRSFVLCAYGADTGPMRGSEVLLANVDEEIIRPVISLFDFRLSSLVRRVGSGFEPFNWRIGSKGTVHEERPAFELSGYCMPVKSGGGQSGYLVIFNGERTGCQDLSRLTFAAHELFTQLTGSAVPFQAMGLTVKEIECLRWTAEGKTSSEIAAIIKLSEHTVNHYLIAAARKLDCVNRVQAVAKALRMGLLR